MSVGAAEFFRIGLKTRTDRHRVSRPDWRQRVQAFWQTL